MYRTIPKPFYILLFCCICLQTTACQSGKGPEFYSAYPSLESLNEWFTTKVRRSPQPQAQFKLIKNPAGYSIVNEKYDAESGTTLLHTPVQIWSSETQAYVSPSDESLNVLGPASSNESRGIANNSNYDENIYFGYPEWADDVVEELESNSQKNARLWYGLARAYSFLGTSILDHRAQANVPHPYNHSLDPAEFTEEMLDKYDGLMDKGIAAFEQSAEMDPEMEVIVGKIGIKAANEHLTAWLDLSIIGQNERAAEYLQADLYPAFLISYAKNLLSSCEPGGILFTNGDNDTYTAHYIQAQYNFRPDVSIVNLSLLNTSRYIHYQKTLVSPELRVPIALTKAEYIGDENAFQPTGEGKTIGLPAPPPSFPRFDTDNPISTIDVKTRGNPSNGYIFKQDIALFAIIEANAWKRPLYFADGVAPSSKMGLEDICRFNGLTSRITPFVAQLPEPIFSDRNGSSIGNSRPDPTYDLMVNQFTYEGLAADANNRPSSDQYVSSSIKYRFFKLLESLSIAEDRDRFEKALNKYLELFPPEKEAGISGYLPLIAFYAENNGLSSASKRLFDASTRISAEVNEKIRSQQVSDKDELRPALQITFNLVSAFKELGRFDEADEWRSKADAMMDAYSNL